MCCDVCGLVLVTRMLSSKHILCTQSAIVALAILQNAKSLVESRCACNLLIKHRFELAYRNCVLSLVCGLAVGSLRMAEVSLPLLANELS